jgi:hypothetical protein
MTLARVRREDAVLGWLAARSLGTHGCADQLRERPADERRGDERADHRGLAGAQLVEPTDGLEHAKQVFDRPALVNATRKSQVSVLEAEHRRALAAVPTGHRSLFVRRTSRIAAGVAGTGVAAAVVIAMLATTSGCARLLLAGWSVVPIAYAVATVAASRVLQRRLRQAIGRTGDPFRDHAALRVADVPGLERELAGRRIHASYAWPLACLWLCGRGRLALLRTRQVLRPMAWATVLSLFPGVMCLCMSSTIVFVSAGAVALVGYRPMAALMAREERRGSAAQVLDRGARCVRHGR